MQTKSLIYLHSLLLGTNCLMSGSHVDPFTGIGKPEPLKHILTGAGSRRIEEANRLVYYVTDEHIVILQARDHY